ncbi:hypothetical protein [Longimicrobium sp.]|uniref:hypothetical protein n=1 Tax=Longimicrobium sp. TaxID=2029185 RepID=UPI002C2EC5FD|nr:hypothetical protein [Longimicrobium sp.]HSU14324.1 hypothetical protein [Longimicrobium sp.]
MLRKAQRHLFAHSHAAVLLAAALLASTAACSDTGTAPARRAPAASAPSLVSAPAARLVSNAVKYHDGSAPHATGRSGTARLEALAVTGGNGVTTLTITTGSLDDPDHAPGQIVKAQLKVFGSDGTALFTENHNGLNGGGTQTFMLAGLAPGARIQVQANVRGIDGRRTDVVTVTETVKQAAALHVDVSMPGQTLVGAPVVITATVSETGGDVGTRADCVLYVDGQAVDRAEDIWVDAGDAVTCAFRYTFTSLGSHTVEVRANGTGGSATLQANAGDQATVDVVGAAHTAWTAEAEDRSSASTSVLDYTWSKPDGSHKEYSNTETTTTRTQAVSVQGTLDRAVQFPLTALDVTVASSGVEWQVEHWNDVASALDANGQACASRQMPEQGAVLFVCNAAQGGATFGYTRFAGTVTYHSQGFSNTFDGLTGTPNVYAWNDGYTLSSSGGQMRPFGGEVKLTLNVHDDAGGWELTPTVALSPFSDAAVVVQPRTCTLSSPYWLDGGTLNSCNTVTTQDTGTRGTAAG